MFSIPFYCERSIKINKSISLVYQTISDFNTWKEWSPWLCQESTCPVHIEAEAHTVGHKQSWDGNQIGSGNIVITNLEVNKAIYFNINFLKPWKSHSKVSFILEEEGTSSIVKWTMQGTLPFFLFFMKKSMSAWIGSDYDRGLSMLKDYLEQGKIESDSQLQGEKSKEGFYYLGKKHKTKISEMPQVMQMDFEDLSNLMKEGKLNSPQRVISLYHSFDMVNGVCEFTSAYAYDEKPENDANLLEGHYNPHKVLQVLHTGSFKHLGNAWSTALGYQRYAKKKSNKHIPWYEEYLNSPHEVQEKDLKTEVNIPVK